MINEPLIKNLLDLTNFQYDDKAVYQWAAYLNGMLLWNKAYNLTAITEPKEMVIKHLFDSIVLYQYLLDKIPSGSILGVGSGAGLPGIPLAIIMPHHEFVLLDSSRKRTRFMQQMVFELGLKNVSVVHSRVQEYDPPVLFDLILSRAFASADDMVAWSMHLLKPQGLFAAMKGQINHGEWEALLPKFKLEYISLNVPMLKEERHLVFLSR